MTVDYERSKFSVSQAKWIPNASQNITSILPPSISDSTHKPDSTHKLSTGATVGIIVAAVCFCLLLIGAGIRWYMWSKGKRRASEKSPTEDAANEKAEFEDTSPQKPNELHGDVNLPGEVEGDGTYYGPTKKHGLEMEGSPGPASVRAEAPGTPGGVEMEGSRGGFEMEGSGVPKGAGERPEIFELPAGDNLGVGAGRERRGQRSSGSLRSPNSPLSPVLPHSPASPASPPSDSNLGSQSDRERRRERDRRRERGRAKENSRRWSLRRSRTDGEPF